MEHTLLLRQSLHALPHRLFPSEVGVSPTFDSPPGFCGMTTATIVDAPAGDGGSG